MLQRICPSGEGPFNRNSLYFPADQGISDSGDAFAAGSQQSHLVAGFRLSPDLRQSVRKKPGIAPPNGDRSLSLDARERIGFP